MTTRAQAIRSRTLKTVVVNETEYLIRKPGKMTLIKCGASQLTFSHQKKGQVNRLRQLVNDPEALLEAVDGDLDKVVAEFTPELSFYAKLCQACMVDPRLHDGPIETCPEGSVVLDQIEDDYAQLGREIMDYAGIGEAQAVAKAAETFRTDAGGDPDRPGGEVVGLSAERDAEGIAG